LGSIDSLGWVYFRDEKYDKAEELTALLVERRMETNGLVDTRTLEAKSLLAFTLQAQEYMKRALSLHLEVFDSRVEVLGPQHEDTMKSMHEVKKCEAELQVEEMRGNEAWERTRASYSTESSRGSPEEERRNKKNDWNDVWTRVKRRVSKPDETF
jgi:hypothetical protein